MSAKTLSIILLAVLLQQGCASQGAQSSSLAEVSVSSGPCGPTLEITSEVRKEGFVIKNKTSVSRDCEGNQNLEKKQ
jgi:hypothetical protein